MLWPYCSAATSDTHLRVVRSMSDYSAQLCHPAASRQSGGENLRGATGGGPGEMTDYIPSSPPADELTFIEAANSRTCGIDTDEWVLCWGL